MNKKEKKISVIILNYNGKDFIADCIDSVLNSNYSNFEVIVIDNGSTDDSYRYLKRKYQKNKQVLLIRSDKNLFFAAGSNFGAQKAKGQNLVFLNNDTVVERNWLKELVKFSLKKSKYLIQPKIISFWNKNIIDNAGGKYNIFSSGIGIGHGEKDLNQYCKSAELDFANGTVFMIEKNFFEKLGGFDQWYQFYYEDVDLNLRSKKQAGKSWYCPKSIVYHKGSLTFKANIAKENFLFHIRKNRLRTVIKNFSGFELTVRLLLLMPIYIGLIIQDLLSPKSKDKFLTLKSISAAVNIKKSFSPRSL